MEAKNRVSSTTTIPIIDTSSDAEDDNSLAIDVNSATNNIIQPVSFRTDSNASIDSGSGSVVYVITGVVIAIIVLGIVIALVAAVLFLKTRYTLILVCD